MAIWKKRVCGCPCKKRPIEAARSLHVIPSTWLFWEQNQCVYLIYVYIYISIYVRFSLHVVCFLCPIRNLGYRWSSTFQTHAYKNFIVRWLVKNRQPKTYDRTDAFFLVSFQFPHSHIFFFILLLSFCHHIPLEFTLFSFNDCDKGDFLHF